MNDMSQHLPAGEQTDQRWSCPHCTSDNLTVYYMEERACAVGTNDDGTSPWPNYLHDELIEIDPELFVFACDSCLVTGMMPVRTGARP